MKRLIVLTLCLLAALYAADRYLPARAVDPWGLVFPRKIVLIFLAILALQSLSSVAVRLFGHGRGLLFSSLLGGFVSSTAVTMTLSRASKHSWAPVHSSGIVAASMAMVVEAALIVLVASPALFLQLMPVWASSLAVGLAFLLARRGTGSGPSITESQMGTFRVMDALKLTVAFAAMLSLLFAVKLRLGQASLMLVSFLGSLFELHSIVFAQVNLPGTMDDGGRQTKLVILVALSAAFFSKAVLAFLFGSQRLRVRVATAMAAMGATAWFAYVVPEYF